MGRQLADDPARMVVAQSPWLGAPGSFRFPWDWSYATYRLILILAVPVFVVTWLVLPVGAYLALAAVVAARAGARSVAVLRGRAWPVTVAVALLVLLWVPVSVLVLPMPLWAALLATPLLSAYAARRVTGAVDFNRPLAYWVGTLHRIAAGPRPTRRAAVLDTTLDAPPADVALSRFHYAALSLPETTMTLQPYHSSTIYLADRWMPSDEASSAGLILSLAREGVSVKVDEKDSLVIESGAGILAVAHPGNWVVLFGEPGKVRARVANDTLFRRAYIAAPAQP